MDRIGLCSVSFRDKSPREILEAAKNACLDCVEWGSDVHARCDDTVNLEQIAAMQKDIGIYCSSYGTYYRIGADKPGAILPYIHAAKVLGTDILRVWCGNKKPQDYTSDELERIFEDCRALVKIAEENQIIICLECHNDTLTETVDSALALMQAIDSPYFRMYWQPIYFNTPEISMEYARRIESYTYYLHVYNWDHDLNRYPLIHSLKTWKNYRKCFSGERTLLLEFMPDDRIESLQAEAETLKRVAVKCPSRNTILK